MATSKEHRYAIIVAGGLGSRMGGDIAKQFLKLRDKPIVAHTIEKFLSLENPPQIILVLPDNYKEYWKEYCIGHNFLFRHTIVSGGITRFHSVKNALAHLNLPGLVAVHDGVRPFVTVEFLEQMYSFAKEYGAVIPVVEPIDSMRIKMEGGHTQMTNRNNYLMVQTPQVFHSELLLEGYKKAYSPSFTDDASVVESTGTIVHTVKGLGTNIKLTKPEDIVWAEALINVF